MVGIPCGRYTMW